MIRSRYLACVWVIGLAALIGCVRTPPTVPTDQEYEPEPKIDVPEEDLKELARGNNEFAIELFKKVAETEKGNIVLSPYSIRTALAMVYAGARGDTKEEMKKVLRFTLPDERLHAAMGASRQQLQTKRGDTHTMSIANSLWGQQGIRLAPDFLDSMKRCYSGGFREVDFSGHPNESRQTINKWIENCTEDRIKELLKEKDIHSGVVLVLTNALYFRAPWVLPFPADGTQNEDFTMASGERRPVPMMNVTGRFRYCETSELTMVELPMQGDRLALVVALPAKDKSFTQVLPILQSHIWDEAVSKPRIHDGTLALPRSKSNSRFELNEPLKGMGMPTAFSGAADLSGMGQQLQIEKVIHGADVAMDEKGAEGAAATAVSMKISAPPPFSFKADRPFVYAVVHRTNGAIIIMGLYNSP